MCRQSRLQCSPQASTRSCCPFSVFVVFVLCVQSGAINCARGATVLANDSMFGYNANPGADNAAALQAAIDHGIATGDTIQVPNVEWTIGSPINIRDVASFQSLNLIFDPGVLVQAQSGQFLGTGDKLFLIENSSNITFSGSGGATLRMRKADYQSAPYLPSEFRHTIQITGGNNITIEGLNIEDSGGDGVYVGSAIIHSRNVVLSNLVVDNNHRNGLSIVSVQDLLVEDCVFRNTDGTPPGAGIDIEPNVFTNVLENIVLRNNVIDSNQQRGIFFSTGAFDNRSAFFDVTVENTTITGGQVGIGFAENGDLGATGSITLRGGSITGTSRAGIYLLNRDGDDDVDVQILDFQLSNVATDGVSEHPIVFDLGIGTPVSGATGAVNFTNISVIDNLNRDFLFASSRASAAGVENVAGTFFVNNPNGATWDLGPNLSNVNIQGSIPEPQTMLLAGIALACLLLAIGLVRLRFRCRVADHALPIANRSHGFIVGEMHQPQPEKDDAAWRHSCRRDRLSPMSSQ